MPTVRSAARSLITLALLASASVHAATVSVVINAAQEVPANVSTGTGTGMFTLNADNTFSFSISFSGLTSGITGAHIHGNATPGQGVPGTNTGIMVDIVGGVVPAGITAAGGTTSGTFTGTNVSIASLTRPGAASGFVTALALGQTYFNLHNSQFPGGEIRGNIPAVTTVIPLPAPALLMLGGLALLGVAARRKV